MTRKLILAVLAVAFLAMPAFASVQNVKISGDIETTAIVRDQFDLGQDEIAERSYQNYLITQTRLRVDADLTDNVSATVGLINERAWGEETAEGDDIDINLAYVTLREMLYSPLTVVIGRQNFAFGNSFVIDSAGTNNTTATGGLNNVAEDLTKRTAQDAVRLTLDYNPLTIDVIASKIDNGNLLGTGLQDDDQDLFGINANYQLGDDMNTVVEGYFWAKIDQSTKLAATTGTQADTVYMPGVRASANVLDGLNLQGELAFQSGNKAATGGTTDNVARRAMAAQVIANYKLPFEQTAEYSPVVTTVYTYVSGDSGPAEVGDTAGHEGEEYYTAWDPMFENQNGGTIFNSLFNLTNCHVLTVRAQVNPMDDLTAMLEWNAMWLDKALNDAHGSGTVDDGTCSGADCLTLNQPDGGSTLPTMTSDRQLGNEVDLKLVYDYTEDVQIGAMMGWFIPGGAFDSKNDQVASQYMLNAKVDF